MGHYFNNYATNWLAEIMQTFPNMEEKRIKQITEKQ